MRIDYVRRVVSRSVLEQLHLKQWNNKVSLRQPRYSLGVITLVVFLLNTCCLSCRIWMCKVFYPCAVPNLSWMRVVTSITSQNLYVTTFIIFLIIMFYYFKGSLMVFWDITPYSLFRRLTFLSCSVSYVQIVCFYLAKYSSAFLSYWLLRLCFSN